MEPRIVFAADAWISELPESLKDQTLNHFIVPGTHDSGTYDLIGWPANEGSPGSVNFEAVYNYCSENIAPVLYKIADAIPTVSSEEAAAFADRFCQGVLQLVKGLAFEPYAQTQGGTIYQQLSAGARSLDLRFFRADATDAAPLGMTPSPLTEGEFYVHHTLAGPNSDVILGDIKQFLEEPGHEKEIIILNFKGMTEGESDQMSDDAKHAFLTDLNDFIGDYLVPKSLGATATLGDVWATGKQVIARFPTGWSSVGVIDDLIWKNTDFSDGFATPPSEDGMQTRTADGYPVSTRWDTPSELRAMMDQFERRSNEYNDFFNLGLNIGVDDAGMMVLHNFLCRLEIVIDPIFVDPIVINANTFEDGFCEVDENGMIDKSKLFSSIFAVANYANPISVAALDDRPREDLNIVSTDFFGVSGLLNKAIELNQVNPPLADAGGPYQVGEGGEIELTAAGTIDFDQSTESLDFAWDLDGDGEYDDAVGITTTFSAAGIDGYSGESKTIGLQVTDDTGFTVVTATTIDILNVTPTIESLENSSPQSDMSMEGDPISISGIFTDPGTLDTHTAIIDWGDGTTSDAVITETAGSGTFSGGHIYVDGGVFDVIVTLTDDDGGTTTAQTTIYITGAGVLNGVLQVVGTNETDHITINWQGNGQYKVHADYLGGLNFKTFPASEIENIEIWLGNGNDHLNLAGNITDLPIVVHGDGRVINFPGDGGRISSTTPVQAIAISVNSLFDEDDFQQIAEDAAKRTQLPKEKVSAQANVSQSMAGHDEFFEKLGGGMTIKLKEKHSATEVLKSLSDDQWDPILNGLPSIA